jgi:hypothetical protein
MALLMAKTASPGKSDILSQSLESRIEATAIRLVGRMTSTASTGGATPSAGDLLVHHPYLEDFDFDPETKRVLSIALERTRVSLGLGDDLADGIIAKRIIESQRPASAIPISYVKAH